MQVGVNQKLWENAQMSDKFLAVVVVVAVVISPHLPRDRGTAERQFRFMPSI